MHMRCAESRMPVYWNDPKTFAVTWRTGNQIINFSHKNSPDQAEGYLDYLHNIHQLDKADEYQQSVLQQVVTE
jgi:hypothetical protein